MSVLSKATHGITLGAMRLLGPAGALHPAPQALRDTDSVTGCLRPSARRSLDFTSAGSCPPPGRYNLEAQHSDERGSPKGWSPGKQDDTACSYHAPQLAQLSASSWRIATALFPLAPIWTTPSAFCAK